jgi:RNA polymerase sigma factor (sigma-70 family)
MYVRDAPANCPAAPAPDAALIAASLDDPAQFAAVFDRHWPAIRAYCVRRGGPDGEDLAADVFKQAFDRRDRYDARHDDARPWLYGIASNLLRQHFRSAGRAARAVERLGALLGRDPPDHGLEARQLGPELTAAIGQLSAGDRETLLLMAWAELDYAEIARALDVPIGTVRSRINRARSRVRAHLRAEDTDDR